MCLLRTKHVSVRCLLGAPWAGPTVASGVAVGGPTLRDGQAAELPQGRGGCWAAEQGQRVGGEGAAVGVRGQGRTGLQEMPRSGNGAPLLLQDEGG